jgi:hypothetical protein
MRCQENPATGQCRCIKVPCKQSPYPQCNGGCPPGKVCQPDSSTDPEKCRCVDVPCTASPFPECNGGCPPGFVCQRNTATSSCQCVQLACDLSPFPQCLGGCPSGFRCEPFKTGKCRCNPIPPACQSSPWPQCGGVCPPNQVCRKVPGAAAACQCYPCAIVAPGEIVEMFFTTKTTLVWLVGPCADWYNVYRLTARVMPDSDDDGVADNYGECAIPELVENQAPDSSSPPSGGTAFYLTTGENDVGEGLLGHARNGLPRPNYSPCP